MASEISRYGAVQQYPAAVVKSLSKDSLISRAVSLGASFMELMTFPGLTLSLPSQAAISALREDLRSWVDREPTAERQEARDRILISFEMQLLTLNLSHLELTSLPYGVSKLSHLKVIDLRSNRLEVLPEELFSFMGSTSIKAKDNEFSADYMANVKTRLQMIRVHGGISPPSITF